MITIFNSYTVYLGHDLSRFHQICDALGAEGIRYKVKVRNRASDGGLFGGSVRSRGMPVGMKPEYLMEYEVLVHRKDADRCRF